MMPLPIKAMAFFICNKETMPGQIIYSSVPKKFIKRIWQHLDFIWMPLVFVTIVAFSLNLHEAVGVIIVTAFALLLLVVPCYDAYHRSIYQITQITLVEKQFEFIVLRKNNLYCFSISSGAISTRLMWLSYKQHTMKLVIFDNEHALFDLYSNGSRESEYELENIVFQMKEALITK